MCKNIFFFFTCRGYVCVHVGDMCVYMCTCSAFPLTLTHTSFHAIHPTSLHTSPPPPPHHSVVTRAATVPFITTTSYDTTTSSNLGPRSSSALGLDTDANRDKGTCSSSGVRLRGGEGGEGSGGEDSDGK